MVVIRSGRMNLGNGKLAFDSYQQANKLEPDNLDYKLSYARMLMSSEDQTDKLRGNQLLRDCYSSRSFES